MEWRGGWRMGVVGYRCPTSGENVTTAIETSKDTLVKMRAMDLTIWVWCPHCMAGHQIKPADAVLEDEVRDLQPLADRRTDAARRFGRARMRALSLQRPRIIG